MIARELLIAVEWLMIDHIGRPSGFLADCLMVRVQYMDDTQTALYSCERKKRRTERPLDSSQLDPQEKKSGCPIQDLILKTGEESQCRAKGRT